MKPWQLGFMVGLSTIFQDVQNLLTGGKRIAGPTVRFDQPTTPYIKPRERAFQDQKFKEMSPAEPAQTKTIKRRKRKWRRNYHFRSGPVHYWRGTQYPKSMVAFGGRGAKAFRN